MRFTLAIITIAFLGQCKPTETKTTSAANLENTYWKLTEINGEPLSTPENGREVHIVLTKEGNEGKLKGFAGCNNMGGSYSITDGKIKFTVISTKMMCEDRMDIENFLLGVLNNADNYIIEGENLKLYEGRTFLANFQSVYFK
jgi:heat shock protein HslJ